MTGKQIAEIPHEVELHLKQAKAQARVEEKYEAQAREQESKLDHLIKKMEDAHTAVGKELCAAQDAGIAAGVFPSKSGGRPKAGQVSFSKTARHVTGFSERTIQVYMLEHRAPEVAKTKTQKHNEQKRQTQAKQREKAKAYEAMQKEAAEEQALEAEVQADLEAKATLHILKARCQSALKAQFKRIGDDQGQLEQLADFIDSFGDMA